jgi:hypothetical protein
MGSPITSFQIHKHLSFIAVKLHSWPHLNTQHAEWVFIRDRLTDQAGERPFTPCPRTPRWVLDNFWSEGTQGDYPQAQVRPVGRYYNRRRFTHWWTGLRWGRRRRPGINPWFSSVKCVSKASASHTLQICGGNSSQPSSTSTRRPDRSYSYTRSSSATAQEPDSSLLQD